MKKALLLGDHKTHPAHDVRSIGAALSSIYDGMFELTICEAYDALTLEALQAYSLVIDYASNWAGQGTKKSVGALLAYVADGGNYFAINEGLLHGSWTELDLLTASRHLGTPTPILLDFKKSDAVHPVSEGFVSCAFSETPMRFMLDPLVGPTVLVENAYADAMLPAMWCRTFGWGKVMCLVPGYQTESFLPHLSLLVYRAGLWFLNRI